MLFGCWCCFIYLVDLLVLVLPVVLHVSITGRITGRNFGISIMFLCNLSNLCIYVHVLFWLSAAALTPAGVKADGGI